MAKKTITIIENIPGTTDLHPPDLEATYEMEGHGDEDHERVKMEYMEKLSTAEMRKKFKEQIKHFAEPLSSMQQEVDEMRKAYNAATDATDLGQLLALMAKASDKKKELDEKVKSYNE
jgi:septation ring formation regulator EzrA